MQIDDLVLISQSDEGLENALSILSQYCEHWLLSVNPKKTEIMIFEKKYRKSTLNKHCFHINRHNTEIVNNYTYLGINFSSNRNLKVSKSNLRYQDKVRRSFFATRRYPDFSKIPSDITKKLFNSLFQPILLYGSEVWGIYDKDDITNWEKENY